MALPLVYMTVQWKVTPGEARPITEALHALMVAARAEHGYVNCSLSTELGESAKLCYREEWQTEDDLQRQIHTTRFAKVAELIERASQEPRVQFHLPGVVRGLDYAEELLGRDRK
jgi:quinol monooxygenase YgiN